MIVAFAGRIASGKSAVSRAVATHYGAPWVSFGNAVRAEAKRRSLGESRKTLQDLGDELIADGWDGFCGLVVGQISWDGQQMLVVDGVRHLGAMRALQKRASLFTVFVDARRERRAAWNAERGIPDADAALADTHPNESELEEVKKRADLIVTNEGTVDHAVSLIVESLDALNQDT